MVARCRLDTCSLCLAKPATAYISPPSHFSALFSWLFLRTARQGAQSVLYAALDMNLDYITGHYIE